MAAAIDLTAVELLVSVADHGSLAAGARSLDMAQPNASRSIARLERRLGLSLLVRSTTGSTLTPNGLLVVQWAREILAATHAMSDGVAALTQSGQGAITVAASQTVAEHLLPLWLSELRSRRPGASVTVHVHNSTEVLHEVLNGRCSVGFVEGPKPPSQTNNALVDTDELVVVCAPNHPWARKRAPLRTSELASTPLVTRELNSGTREALDDALGRPALSALELPSNAAVRVSAASGAAPAVLSRLAVADAIAAGTLLEVPLLDLDLHRKLHAIWIGPRRLAGPVADLVEIAKGVAMKRISKQR